MRNIIQAAIQQIQGGGKADPATATKEQEVSNGEPTTVDAFESVTDSDDILGMEANPDDVVDASESTPDGSPVSDPKAAKPHTDPKAKQATPDKEVITISDDKGRRKVTIDYSDRASIKKAFEMMHGARKWQAERDRLASAEKDLSEKYKKVSTVMDALEEAYRNGGELGVIDVISGKPGASAEFIRRQVDRAKFLERASPEEKEQLAQKERLEHLEREHQRLRSEGEEREKRISLEREAAELQNMESRVHPSFEKYRFEGKLGSAEDEDMFDEMLWNTALKRLKPYEEKGVEITKELVDQEFRTVASALRKRVGAAAEKKAAQVVDQKKREATENVQASTMNAYSKGGAAAEAQDMIKRGDFFSLFKKHGSAMSKK